MNAQLQVALLRYAGEANLVKVKQGNGWNGTKGAKRGRLEIIAEILRFCDQQKNKTSIMYNNNLNYTQLKFHLKFLTSQGLLTHKKGTYITTEKGHRFLELFAQLNNILKEENT